MLRQAISLVGFVLAGTLLLVGCGGGPIDPCSGVTCQSGQVCKEGACVQEAAKCAEGQSQCGESCHDTKADKSHCGACNNACRDKEACKEGKCVLTCDGGKQACGPVCVDIQTDTKHCGACNQACKAGEVCNQGACALFCSSGTTQCDGTCVDTNTNTKHCGACGTACKTGESCNGGQCIFVCDSGKTNCSGSCVDTASDAKNCGGCGTACKTGEVCKAGACKPDCPKEQAECSGTCVDTQSDNKNCGGCGKVCGPETICKAGSCEPNCKKDETFCSNTCVDTQTNDKHCGTCGNDCGPGKACKAGSCESICKKDETFCSNSCVDTQRNNKHCGTCGNACQARESCIAGVCKPSWAESIGSTTPGGSESIRAIAQDGQGNFYITGSFHRQLALGTFTLNRHGGGFFVAKLNSQLQVLWARPISADGYETQQVAVDGTGNVYLTGAFISSVAVFGTTTLQNRILDKEGTTLGPQVFVAKLDTNGKWLWATSGGGKALGYNTGIAADSKGNVFVAGVFCDEESGDFGTTSTFGSTTLTTAGDADIFVAKLDKDGTWLWTKAAGTADYDTASGVGVDTQGNVYVGGLLAKANTTFGSLTLSVKGTGDAFVAKLDPQGNWKWVTAGGSPKYDNARTFVTDGAGNSYIIGAVYDGAVFGKSTLTVSGRLRSLFVAKVDNTGQWVWANNGSGTRSYAYHSTVDNAGNVYLTGTFNANESFGTIQLAPKGNGDIFLAKLDSAGKWLWAESAGGTRYSYGYGVTADSSGNAFVVGQFYGKTTFGSSSYSSKGGENNDAFVAKYSSTGVFTSLQQYGGTGGFNDSASGIARDSAGNLYVTGRFRGELTFGSTTLSAPSSDEMLYVAKMTSSGQWAWAVTTSNGNGSGSYDMTVDGSGNVYVVGQSQGTTKLGSCSYASKGGSDIFVAKLNSNGACQWVAGGGGGSFDFGHSVVVGSQGNVYVTGYVNGTGSFGSLSLSNKGSNDLFVGKLDPTGQWLWVTNNGSSSYDYGYGIAIDKADNLYITGVVNGVGTFGSLTLSNNGKRDLFVGKMNDKGEWQWVTNGGGSGEDYGRGIAVDASGNVFVVGEYSATATFGTTTLSSQSKRDIFVGKLDNTGKWFWGKSAGGASNNYGSAIDVNAKGNVFITGRSQGGSPVFGSTTLKGYPGSYYIYVSSLDTNGAWRWTKAAEVYNAEGSPTGESIVAGPNDTAYVSGFYAGVASFGPHTKASTGGSDLFIWLVNP
ncbi:MAG: hypothetical protein EP343_19935 [Deltaproteobacteria bacterium]|nr:MAG: hypothetical protein EP343_19935 [Deltaproteobacteria bacterium]